MTDALIQQDTGYQKPELLTSSSPTQFHDNTPAKFSRISSNDIEQIVTFLVVAPKQLGITQARCLCRYFSSISCQMSLVIIFRKISMSLIHGIVFHILGLRSLSDERLAVFKFGTKFAHGLTWRNADIPSCISLNKRSVLV
jgi:ABC-type phosphonate transport system ATPase subunit